MTSTNAIQTYLDEFVSDVKQLPSSDLGHSFILLNTILSNILAAPQAEKFRRINTEKISSKLQSKAAINILSQAGFVENNGYLIMNNAPEGDQLKNIQAIQVAVEGRINQLASSQDNSSSKTKLTTEGAENKSQVKQSDTKSEKKSYDWEEVEAEAPTVIETADYVYFWHPPNYLSQWTQVPFEIDGIRYNCAEQAMMAFKAKLFGDHTAFAQIVKETDPKKHKALGRKVKNFNEDVWQKSCQDIVYQISYAKFSQNPQFRQKLLATGNKVIAEASPFDNIWGIGISPENARDLGKNQWQGKNWLGIALMKVRDQLRKDAEKSDK
jgi:ribA/ribD-fused uncharacterized protein